MSNKVFDSKSHTGIHECPRCGSSHYKKHGTTSTGMQRYICKDCRKSFSENHNSTFRYTHLTTEKWLAIIKGLVENTSLSQIAKECSLSTGTVWSCKMKICKVLMTLYEKQFKESVQAADYCNDKLFKGKRDPEFFIYTLRRMPRHHYTHDERVQWLENAGLYEKLQQEEPEYLAELLTDVRKTKNNSKHSLAEESELSSYMSKERMINTEYTELTLILFWWLHMYKSYSTQQQVQMIWDMMNGNISDTKLHEKVSQA